MKIVAKIAINGIPLHADKLFNYLVPSTLLCKIKVGMRVIVPFGKLNNKKQGLILKIINIKNSDINQNIQLKFIDFIIDLEPILTQEMMLLFLWIKNITFSTYFDTLKLFAGNKCNIKIHKKYIIADADHDFITLLNNEQILFLQKNKNEKISYKNIKQMFNNKIIFDLISKNILKECFQIFQIKSCSEKKEKIVKIIKNENYNEIQLTPKQKETFELLNKFGEISVKNLQINFNIKKNILDALIKKNVAMYSFAEKKYDFNFNLDTENYLKKNFNLNSNQQIILNKLYKIYNQNIASVTLLSANNQEKIIIMLNFIKKTLKDGNTILYIVTNIIEADKFTKIFKQFFNSKVEILHECYDEKQTYYNHARNNGDAKIIIGTKSALFMPLNNLKLIVINQEEDHEFYNSNTILKYNPLNVAKFRAAQNNAMLLLTTQTPSIESYYKAKIGTYNFLKIPHHLKHTFIEVIDMNNEISQNNFTIFSQHLILKMTHTLKFQKKIILIANTYGYNNTIQCCDCGKILQCPNCNVNLIYHQKKVKKNEKLQQILFCHYCGYSCAPLKKCIYCGSISIQYTGTGIEKIESQLKKIFANAKIGVTNFSINKYTIDNFEILNNFKTGQYDILLTNKIAIKFIDFTKNIDLICLLNETFFNYNQNYKFNEEKYQNIRFIINNCEQFGQKTKILIQTHTPNDSLLDMIINHNFEKFYNFEINNRKLLSYPPFLDIYLIGFCGKCKNTVKNAAIQFKILLDQALKDEQNQNLNLKVLAISKALIFKINNKVRYKILIKCKNTKIFRNMMKFLFINVSKQKLNNNVFIFFSATIPKSW